VKPVLANSSREPISKIPITKRTGGVTKCIGPEFKLQYCKKRKQENTLLFQLESENMKCFEVFKN
jgi:hypothetical protein